MLKPGDRRWHHRDTQGHAASPVVGISCMPAERAHAVHDMQHQSSRGPRPHAACAALSPARLWLVQFLGFSCSLPPAECAVGRGTPSCLSRALWCRAMPCWALDWRFCSVRVSLQGSGTLAGRVAAKHSAPPAHYPPLKSYHEHHELSRSLTLPVQVPGPLLRTARAWTSLPPTAQCCRARAPLRATARAAPL